MPADTSDYVQITLRDIWAEQQAQGKRMDAMNLTLVQALARLETVEVRNTAADAMHKALDTRLTACERVHDMLDPYAWKPTIESRVLRLEEQRKIADAAAEVLHGEHERLRRRSAGKHTRWHTVAAGIAVAIAMAALLWDVVHA